MINVTSGDSHHPFKYLECPHCVHEYLHTATLPSLTPGARFAYQIDGSPTVHHFTAKPLSEDWAPTFAVYGDLGTVDGEGVVSPSLRRLVDEVATGSIDGVLHVGDFAYGGFLVPASQNRAARMEQTTGRRTHRSTLF